VLKTAERESSMRGAEFLKSRPVASASEAVKGLRSQSLAPIKRAPKGGALDCFAGYGRRLIRELTLPV
jgi:hypothetical protein